MKITNVSELKALCKKYKEKSSQDQEFISICCGTGCRASGALEVLKAFRQELKKSNLDTRINIKDTGCHGFCEKGPLVVIHPQKIFYNQVKPQDVQEIVERTLIKGEIIEELLYQDPVTEKKIEKEEQVTFYNKQQRLIFGKNGIIQPEKIEDYLALDGYLALGKALTQMSPPEVIKEITESGLRGRGGAGFLTGRKWDISRNTQSDIKYIICNADEGDPGAFMDRSLLEGNPHSILEGMIIGAYAVGAQEGYIYVRKEYPLAVKNLEIALKQAEEYGLLGENILNTGFSFKINLFLGAGAFVCGEETGLIASIEGKSGEPRPKPPYPAQKGLWQKPTVINNVKTWANVPLIINRGAGWFNQIGTEHSKGTMIFSLVGKINNTGLIEVPMGITLREIVYEIGGGIPGKKAFKAIQTGGPSGGCIPEDKLETPVDFDKLTEIGSMMGSGGMIVMDEDTCMVDVARYFLSFLVEESCGQCVPCREGTYQLFQIVTRIAEGKGKKEDIQELEELSATIKNSSLCAFGKTAPNPVLSTLKYFKEEYLTHIQDKKCPAGVCKALFQYKVDNNTCKKCGICYQQCPVQAITWEKKQVAEIDQATCTKCGICFNVCSFDAIVKE